MSEYILEPAAIAIAGTPAHAFASHKARASAIAREHALAGPLDFMGAEADENNAIRLVAHLQAASDDPEFRVPGMELSRTLAPKVLKSLKQGHLGQVGTQFGVDDDGTTDVIFKRGDYDMALKGLMVVAYRYRNILTADDVNFILDKLLPSHLVGGHDPRVEKFTVFAPFEDVPETENHMLMINSTRYLANQLFFDRFGDKKYNNRKNGLMKWMLNYLHTIAKHDFLEFNSRPYQRLSLHVLFNLHEFAGDPEIRTAAQILLDYSMVKFAISSNWLRRLGPFRRLKQYSNRADNPHNELVAPKVEGDDSVIGFFLMYAGPTDIDGNPTDKFPDGWGMQAVIAGLAAYRPPPAAYILAMQRDIPPFQHRFYHGLRPKLPGTDDQADGGVEIYYKSPSFLLTAGGMFLNSGYGGDETPFSNFEQTAIAQATTLLPTRKYVKFADLIRFDPYPDERRAVNTAVHRGFACGANLRPSEKMSFNDTTTRAPALASHNGQLFLSWKGSGNENLNAAKVHTTEALDIDGIIGLEGKIILGDSSKQGPALASHNGRLFIAWKGADNHNLNLMFSDDNGVTFHGNKPFSDTSEFAPALVSHNGRLFFAWTGRGNEKINIAKVIFFGNTAGGFGIEGFESHVILGDSSEQGPALASHNGRLFLAWKGADNHNLNLMFSDDNGATFHGKKIFSDRSEFTPGLASHGGRLFLAWTGRDNEKLNVARIILFGNTAGAFGIEGLESHVILGDSSKQGPALASHNGRLFLAWKGAGNDNLNLISSRDGVFQTERWLFLDLGRLGFYVAIYRTLPAFPEDFDVFQDTVHTIPSSPPEMIPIPMENLGFLYAMEAGGMGFEKFKQLTLERNTTLPAQLEYGGRYTFHSADDHRFSFWLRLAQEKYKARVVHVNEENPITDFTSLPLVEGDYLKADKHTGLIHILQPRCISPIILDFRNPEKPTRQDNMGICPEPWLERAQALFDFSQRLSQANRHKEVEVALNDRIKIYQQLADLNAAGPDPAFARLLALSKIAIDFSVPEKDLREWLNNPEFTPYPAMTEAILQLLKGKTLKQPVFLDVIVFNYENTPGVASPRRVTDVDITSLKAAVLAGYNTRYGETISDFQRLVG
jgi:hypothetical protein